MKQRTVSLPAMQAMDFAITKTTLDAGSLLNQNDDHIHDVCEVYVNLSGNVAFSVENRLYSVKRGSVIITMPYEYHHCIYRTNDPHSHFWITFTPNRELPFLSPFFRREKGLGNRIDLGEEALQTLCEVLETLLNQQTDDLERWLLILRFFRILTEGVAAEPTANLEDMPPDVAQALGCMDRDLSRELDIRALARACHVSVNTLERHFQEALGISPMAMLRRKRLFASMLYLRDGCSVTEAAARSGFPDYSNYIQLFRKQFGITPGRYRKQRQ